MQPKNEVEQGFRKVAYEKQRIRPSIDKSALKAFGIKNETHFETVYDNLCKRWWDKIDPRSDTDGGMLVNKVIVAQLNNPVVLAIIANDVDAFRKHYNAKDGDIFCLEFCCLCGADKIVNDVFLHSSDKQKCLVLSKNAIGYALSSGNLNFAMKLAETVHVLGKVDPGQVAIYSFGQYECANAIKRMFVSTKKENLTKEATLSDKPTPDIVAKSSIFR